MAKIPKAQIGKITKEITMKLDDNLTLFLCVLCVTVFMMFLVTKASTCSKTEYQYENSCQIECLKDSNRTARDCTEACNI